MRDLDLTSLRLFVAACDLQNIARAAEREHIVASAISKRIAQMEHAMGVPLLERRRRGVRPTPAGQALLEHARTVLYTMDRIATDAASFGAGLVGQVRMVASVSAIAESLLDDVAAFMRAPDNRNIKVDIEERTSRDLVVALRDGAATVGVCWDNVDFGGLDHRPYRRDQLVLAVPREHALANASQPALRADAGLRARRTAAVRGGDDDAAAGGGACRPGADVSRAGLELRRRVSRRRCRAGDQHRAAAGRRELRPLP